MQSECPVRPKGKPCPGFLHIKALQVDVCQSDVEGAQHRHCMRRRENIMSDVLGPEHELRRLSSASLLELLHHMKELAYQQLAGETLVPSAYVSRSPSLALLSFSLMSWTTTLEARSKNTGLTLPMMPGCMSWPMLGSRSMLPLPCCLRCILSPEPIATIDINKACRSMLNVIAIVRALLTGSQVW